MSSDLFDFGFTVVDENELEAVQKASTTAQAASDTVEQLQDKLDKLYNAIQPLLSNLKKNPEKDYIYWPKRLKKIEDFEDMISKIVE